MIHDHKVKLKYLLPLIFARNIQDAISPKESESIQHFKGENKGEKELW